MRQLIADHDYELLKKLRLDASRNENFTKWFSQDEIKRALLSASENIFFQSPQHITLEHYSHSYLLSNFIAARIKRNQPIVRFAFSAQCEYELASVYKLFCAVGEEICQRRFVPKELRPETFARMSYEQVLDSIDVFEDWKWRQQKQEDDYKTLETFADGSKIIQCLSYTGMGRVGYRAKNCWANLINQHPDKWYAGLRKMYKPQLKRGGIQFMENKQGEVVATWCLRRRQLIEIAGSYNTGVDIADAKKLWDYFAWQNIDFIDEESAQSLGLVKHDRGYIDRRGMGDIVTTDKPAFSKLKPSSILTHS